MSDSELAKRKKRLIKAKTLMLARKDVNTFAEYCFTDEKGHPIEQQVFHRAWQAHCDKYKFAGIIGPRGHGKSQQIVIFRTIFEIGLNPGIRIKIISNDLPSARKRLKAMRSQIKQNRKIREVFPHLKPSPDEEEWTKEAITVEREIISVDPTIEARAIRSIGTGGRADLNIYDDICDFKNAMSAAEREKVKKAFHEDWQNLLEPDGRAVYVCTPWHQKDLTHELQKNKEWKFRADVVGPNFEPLWPEKWTRERLIKKFHTMPRSAYNRAYRGIAYSEEERLFTEASVRAALKDIDPREVPTIVQGWPIYVGVDIASGKKTSDAKYSVIFVAAIHPTEKVRMVCEIRRGQWNITQLAQHLNDVYETWSPQTIFVENNAVQHMIVGFLKTIGCKGLPIKGIYTGREKMDEDIGVPAMALDFDNDLWAIPYASEHAADCSCVTCTFVEECLMFPDWDTSDIIMAAWLATRHLEKGRCNLDVLGSFDMASMRTLRETELVTESFSSNFGEDRPFGNPYEEDW